MKRRIKMRDCRFCNGVTSNENSICRTCNERRRKEFEEAVRMARVMEGINPRQLKPRHKGKR